MLFGSSTLCSEGRRHRKLSNMITRFMPDAHGLEAAVCITGGPSDPLNTSFAVRCPQYLFAARCFGVQLAARFRVPQGDPPMALDTR